MPRKKREATTATTAEITIGVNAVTAKSPRISSPANSAPAIGALKVAEIPAAAPHPTRVRICVVLSFSSWPSVEPKADPIWDDRAFAAHGAAGSDRQGRRESFHRDDPGAQDSSVQRHGLHDLRNAVTARLFRKEVDQRPNDEAARGRNRDAPVPRQVGGLPHRVAGLGEQPFPGELGEPVRARECEGLDGADQQPERHRAEGTGQADEDRGDHHEEVAAAAK